MIARDKVVSAEVAEKTMWFEEFVALGLSKRLARLLVREGLNVEKVSLMAGGDLFAIKQLGEKGMDAIVAQRLEGRLLPPLPEPEPEPREPVNSDFLNSAQWGYLAYVAEKKGYGDLRLSELLPLARTGELPWPEVT